MEAPAWELAQARGREEGRLRVRCPVLCGRHPGVPAAAAEARPRVPTPARWARGQQRARGALGSLRAFCS